METANSSSSVNRLDLRLLGTEFVRKFFAHDRQGDADSRRDGFVERGPKGEAVNEIVETVAENDHPGQSGDRRVPTFVVNHVLVTVAPLGLLQKR